MYAQNDKNAKDRAITIELVVAPETPTCNAVDMVFDHPHRSSMYLQIFPFIVTAKPAMIPIKNVPNIMITTQSSTPILSMFILNSHSRNIRIISFKIETGHHIRLSN